MSLREGRERRDDGTVLVDGAMPDLPKEELWDLWETVCRAKPEVTSDDLWALVDDELAAEIASHPNFIGTIFLTSARKGWTEDTGRSVRTKRTSGAARRITVWRSLLHGLPKVC